MTSMTLSNLLCSAVHFSEGLPMAACSKPASYTSSSLLSFLVSHRWCLQSDKYKVHKQLSLNTNTIKTCLTSTEQE